MSTVQARALIVEDSPEIRTLVRRVLLREKFEVDEASNGSEGLRKVNDEVYDLLVLDLMMPPPNGFDILEFMKMERVHLLKHTVVITALHNPKLPADVCQCLEKPFDLRAFTEFVHRCAHHDDAETQST